MKLFVLLISCAVLAASLTQLLPLSEVKASTVQVCDPQSKSFAATTRSAVADDAGSDERAERALNWLKGMMGPIANQGDGSVISPSVQYSPEYQGEVSGVFELANPTSVVSGSPLRVTAPQPLNDSYRGIVSGTSTHVGAQYEVRASLFSDIEYDQPSVIPTRVSDDGTWSLDLSPINLAWTGSWRFRLYDTATSQQVGQSWPQAERYQDIVVQAFSVTDDAYLQHSEPARPDNSWSFPSMGQGTKMFRLYNTASDQVLAEYYQPESTGLIRSYEYLPGQDGYGTSRALNSYVYDQSLALLVAIGANDRVMADELLRGLASIQATTGPFAGAFPSHANQRDPLSTASYYYTGSNAFVAYALAKYYQQYGDSGGVLSMLERVLGFFETQKTSTGPASGLYRGGGEVRSDGSANNITWHSTEHNTDLWHVLELTGRLLGGTYQQQAAELSAVIVEKLWNAPEQRFNQGYQDTSYALDTASWGSIFLAAIGDTEKARQSIEAAEAYKVTLGDLTGYTLYLQDTSTPTVWYEGTFGVALAQRAVYGSADSRAAHTLRDTYDGQGDNGAWQYALDADLSHDRTDAYSVASTAWYLLATDYTTVMWSECIAPPELPAAEAVNTIQPIVKEQAQNSPKVKNERVAVTEEESEAAFLNEDMSGEQDTRETQVPGRNDTPDSDTSTDEIPQKTGNELEQLPIIIGVGLTGLGTIAGIGYVIYRRYH